MSDSQRHILIYGTDGTSPSYRKAFSGTRNGLFEVMGGRVPACMKGVLESRNVLFRATETAGARSERIHIRFLYTINAFALPVFLFYYVKIFYFRNCISMHSGILRAFSIPSFPPQQRPPVETQNLASPVLYSSINVACSYSPNLHSMRLTSRDCAVYHACNYSRN